jgi:polar amino acid transport system ATP-binding protein
LTIGYSEKTERLEIVCEINGNFGDPLQQEAVSGNLGLMIINNLTERIQFRCEDGRDILELQMKKPASGALEKIGT